MSTRDALHALVDALPEELLWLAEMHLAELHANGGLPAHDLSSAFEAAGPIRAEDVRGAPMAAGARFGPSTALPTPTSTPFSSKPPAVPP
ncbi:MAG: hypothetical protein IPG47_13975 [Thermoflexaceae bacterium]|nr:hypothetical protein [Thermoflexaceae bacterium]